MTQARQGQKEPPGQYLPRMPPDPPTSDQAVVAGEIEHRLRHRRAIGIKGQGDPGVLRQAAKLCDDAPPVVVDDKSCANWAV